VDPEVDAEIREGYARRDIHVLALLVREHRGGLTMYQIAELSGMKRATVIGVLGYLCEVGEVIEDDQDPGVQYIYRCADPIDTGAWLKANHPKHLSKER
jgi:predicted transcriptional regulator